METAAPTDEPLGNGFEEDLLTEKLLCEVSGSGGQVKGVEAVSLSALSVTNRAVLLVVRFTSQLGIAESPGRTG